LHEFQFKKVGEWGTRPSCRKKWGDAVPRVPAPLHPWSFIIIFGALSFPYGRDAYARKKSNSQVSWFKNCSIETNG